MTNFVDRRFFKSHNSFPLGKYVQALSNSVQRTIHILPQL